MSYRIHVQPEAGSLLSAFAPHVVLRLGRALAELADTLSGGEEFDADELRVEDCVLRFVVDRAEQLLRVVAVEQRNELVPAWATAGA
jgi:hypothetical protein